jgi:hypothetical protein
MRNSSNRNCEKKNPPNLENAKLSKSNKNLSGKHHQ